MHMMTYITYYSKISAHTYVFTYVCFLKVKRVERTAVILSVMLLVQSAYHCNTGVKFSTYEIFQDVV